MSPNRFSRSLIASEIGSCFVYAISLPDGDHAKLLTPLAPLVRLSASPPPIAMRYSWRLPSRSDTNASVDPSGDHAGCRLEPLALVTCRDWPVAASPIQISVS